MELRRRTDGGGTEYPDGGCQEGTVWFSDCIDLVLLDRPRRRRRNRRKPALRFVLLPRSFFEDRDDDDSPTAGFSLSPCPQTPAVLSAPGRLTISSPSRLLFRSWVRPWGSVVSASSCVRGVEKLQIHVALWHFGSLAAGSTFVIPSFRKGKGWLSVWSGGKACRPHMLQRGEASTGTQKISKLVPLTSCVKKKENGKSPYPPAKRAEKRSAEGAGAQCRVRV